MARNKSGPGKYKQILSGAGVLATSAVSPVEGNIPRVRGVQTLTGDVIMTAGLSDN